ncbi:MAG: DUF1622 domain-containing protein [Candidatus Nanopelagicales bacterium]
MSAMDMFFENIIIGFDVAGVATMIVGFAISIFYSARTWHRTKDGEAAYHTLREMFGAVILLGLEILVAADLVRTVTSTPSLEDAAVLGMIVIIRTVLSFSLQVEIEGVAPWRRAMLTGPAAVSQAVGRAQASDGTPV